MAESTRELSDDGPRGGAQTVERALAILNLFRDGPDHLSLSVISRTTGLNVSTAHRLVRTLVNGGFMEQDEATEKYRLGAGLAVLGQRAMGSAGLDRAQVVLDRLSASSGESVSLSRRVGNSVQLLLSAGSPQGLRFEHPSGGAIEIHASAMGKVVLAFDGEEPSVATVAVLGPLVAFTERTISSPAALLVDLQQVRHRRAAFNVEERHLGVCGVAVPVTDRLGRTRFALGIQGPSVRLTMERMLDLVGPLTIAAEEISHYLTGER